MTLTEVRSPQSPSPPPTLRGGRRKFADGGFRLLALGCGLLVLAILVLIAVVLTNQAWPAFTYSGLKFFTSSDWDPAHNKFGALAFIYGTLATSTIALVIAVPISLGIALFLTELAPPRLRTPVIYLIDLLAAIPSVVYGLWGVLYLAEPLGRLYGHISNAVDGIPILDSIFHGQDGRSFFTAGIIVALMIIPIITSLSREVFATVPRTQKEAALALGSTRWEMIRTSVLGYGRAGVVGAVMLGLGRAMGETIAVALVIGSIPRITLNMFRAGDAMAAVIANEFGEASDIFRASLIALGLVLFVITIVVNVVARSFVSRSEKAAGGLS